MKLQYIFSLLISLIAIEAIAEEKINDNYAPFIYFEDDTSFLILAGEIDIRSSLNFKRFIMEHGVPDVLILDSPGGLVHTALDISLEVDRLEITTAIPEGSGCYSSCSFIFLAGSERYAEGELGVHQVSSEDSNLYRGQLTISDIIDVLNKFDTPPELFVPMLRTPPSEMYILGAKEIENYGFLGRREESSVSYNAEPVLNDLEKEALIFVEVFNDLWSGKLDADPLQVIQLYDQNVLYYDNNWTKQKVLEDKKAFQKRWPVRDYVFDSSRSYVSCKKDNRCNVKGFVLWEAKSPEEGRFASGESQFDLEMVFRDDRFYITKENSNVVKRN